MSTSLRRRHGENQGQFFLKIKIAELFESYNAEAAMKKIFALTLLATLPAFAGTPAESSKAVVSAPTEPSMTQWFIGGSYGQFDVDNNLDHQLNNEPLSSLFELLEDTDDEIFEDILENIDEQLDGDELDLPDFEEVFGNLEELDKDFEEITLNDLNNALPRGYGLQTRVSDVELDMYTIHFGRELGNYSGFDMSAYLELGWLTGDMTWGLDYISPGNGVINIFTDQLDLDVIPLTANFKVERMFTSSVGAYLSAGLGYAWTNLESDSFGIDESDGGFYAHAAAGLVWNVNESFELFGGARWVHLESLDFGNSGFELEDTLGWEVGARYNF